MRRIIICTTFFSMFLGGVSYGQHVFFQKAGIIEFEKTVNMYALIKKSIGKENEILLNEAFDKYRQNNPQFKVFRSSLYFSNSKTLFTPAPATPSTGFFSDLPMTFQNNIVFTDLKSDTQVNKKAVFKATYLLSDSIKKVKWKITDETKVIAGYNCRRANAIIMDSVYVVAFYSNEILVSGGPESFSGLPGMILQVTLPHDNITWMATKIQIMDVPEKDVEIPHGGKAVSWEELRSILKSASKDWGDRTGEFMKSFFL
jgi:GLPGLI family protein